MIMGGSMKGSSSNLIYPYKPPVYTSTSQIGQSYAITGKVDENDIPPWERENPYKGGWLEDQDQQGPKTTFTLDEIHEAQKLITELSNK